MNCGGFSFVSTIKVGLLSSHPKPLICDMGASYFSDEYSNFFPRIQATYLFAWAFRLNCLFYWWFQATAEKLKCQKEAEQTAMTIELANRLVGGLASENVRWAESVADFKEQEKTLPGDVLLTTAFVSYMGCFTRKYRDNLMNGKWLPFLKGQSVCSRWRKKWFLSSRDIKLFYWRYWK